MSLPLTSSFVDSAPLYEHKNKRHNPGLHAATQYITFTAMEIQPQTKQTE
jgi:hypothetical protein